MNSFTFNTAANIRFQEGAAANLGTECQDTLGERVLFVTDQGLIKIGLAQGPLESLRQTGITVTLFDQVEADPSLDTLIAAVDKARQINATGVVGFGGGSSMDVAKLTALLVGSKENLAEAWGVDNATGPRLPLVLIPTTAGTGSEVTPIAILTIGQDEKRGVSSAIILPDVAILDPLLTTSLPASITAATGIDAMVHAIEGYASRGANNNPISKILATESLKLLGANIELAVTDGTNIKARGAMLLGSMLAGMAFANSPVAAVHALAYPIGGTFHVPHGLSNALVLPHVLRFNAPEAAQEYAELAPFVFPDIDTTQNSQEVCAEFIERLAVLSATVGLQQKLREVSITRDDLPSMARDAMKQTRLLVNNPRKITEQDALAIYQAAW
ncbi:MAG: iron-containing alcohol dehydrogenase [Planctomycetaceae bacterium]|nr:iron-containing alcohol dehydrogenase [Planctomycetaceae bacterium]